ncbi:MAG: hypothetical protein KC731_38805 [Myxococcales bacterium]|nr:hypothetical protein [Myxococcales bacterium]
MAFQKRAAARVDGPPVETKKRLGDILVEPEPPGIDEVAWGTLAQEREDLRPEGDRVLSNPFTGEAHVFPSDSRTVEVVAGGAVLGVLRWSAGVPERLEVWAEPRSVDAVTAIAKEVAEALGGVLRPRATAWQVNALLEGIDEVDWGSHVDCAGHDGPDMPAILRGLLSPDAATRSDANDRLEASFHQGTLYPSGAAAFPFLLRLLVERDIPDRTPVALYAALGLAGIEHEAVAADPAHPHAPALAVARTAIRLLAPFLRSSDLALRTVVTDAFATLPPALAGEALPHVTRALELALTDDDEQALQRCLRVLRGEREEVAAEDARERQARATKERQRREAYEQQGFFSLLTSFFRRK